VFDERSSKINYVRAMQDPAIKFFSNYYLWINAAWLLALALIDINLIWAISAAYVLEQFRLGLLNTVSHIPGLPFGYKNHPDVPDNSQNNYVLGILSLGFGWHNNHHKNAGKLILTEHWWEIDLEGYFGWLLSLTGKKSQ
jgi:stearoyl-CoA desaturase (delta-9 desaturase)